MRIRPLEQRDWSGWLELWSGYNAFYGREGATALPLSVTQQTWTRLLDANEPMHALVAEVDGELAGIVHIVIHPSTSRANDVCYLQDLFTAPSQRGKGVARALIEAVYERAKALGCCRVYWQTKADNAAARALYDKVAEHQGFIVYSHEIGEKRKPSAPADWAQRASALWSQFDDMKPDEFVARMDALASELPDSPVALYERGGARDSVGRTDEAIPLYRAALDAGLQAERRQAVIQLASSLRALGHAQESADLLMAEMKNADDELSEAVRGFLALALVDLGREREAVAVALDALSHYLPRYRRSLAAYARKISDSPLRADGGRQGS
jgi:GNAT superfamily N-acetyltransferase